MIKDLYLDKEKFYFGTARKDLLLFFEGKVKKILEIGCGEGATLKMLKALGVASEVVGVDINEEALKAAKGKLDRVFIGNIEEMDLPYKNYFDYIIFADVLEHLVDPWKVLGRFGNYLKEDGYVIASLPNIRNYDIFKELFLKGEWSYKCSGLLDKGHLRFFTRKEITTLFTNAGFLIEEMDYNFSPPPNYLKYRLFNLLTFNKFFDLFILQFLIKAKKS